MSDAARLLIVDDEPRNLDALEAMLASSGCAIVRATSSDEALLSLLHGDFAAIVLDIRMPGINGIELAKLIKQRKRTRDVPILFLTAHLMDEEDVLRGYGAGAVDYLSKPVNADVLRSKIGVFVELHKKTRDLAALNEALHREIGERRKAQEALEQANQELEKRVGERTTALTLAHDAARENEERLRMAIEVARIAAWQWDLTTGKMTWSTDPEALFGFPAGAFGPDLRIGHALHPDDGVRVQRAIEAALTGGTYECEYRAVRPNGSIAWITERGRLIATSEGSRMVGISRDVSTEREAQLERERLLVSERRARDEAERQSRIKDEFLATLSHELRTPMNAILGWLSMLLHGQAGDPQQALAVIERNAKAQAHLIEDLLLMNKLTFGMAQLDLAQIDVATAVEAAVQNLQPAASAKNIRLSTHLPRELPQVCADVNRLQQILWNLLHNGVKFTPPGGRVDLHAEHVDAVVRIVVRDTGQGIASEFLPHVFDRFWQADSSTTRKAWGLGLGLSIAKHLVELHGGTLRVESDGPGRGAAFILQLPVMADVRAATSGGGCASEEPLPPVELR